MHSMSNSKQFIFYFLLIAAIGFTGWLLTHRQRTPQTIHSNSNHPDSIAEDVTIVNMDTDGKPSSRLSAVKMTHFPTNNITFALQPNLTIFLKNEQPWYITAIHGKSTDGNTMIQLWDNVKFLQPGSHETPESTVLTESFTFWPRRKWGETDKPITLLQPGTKITAIGLTADTNTGRIDLLKDVRGSYAEQS